MDAQQVIADREDSHGDYAKQAGMSQALKAIIRRPHKFEYLDDTHRESLDMIAVKISRIINGDQNNPDHWLDIAGYAMLVHNILTKGTHLAKGTE